MCRAPLRARAAAEQFGFSSHASADAVAAPQESSQTHIMPLDRDEPRKLLGNNRRPQPGCVAPLSLPAPGNGPLARRQVHADPSWSGPRQRRRLRRKSAAVTLGAAPRRAASSTARTAATKLRGRRAGPQDSPTHSKAAQASITKLSPDAGGSRKSRWKTSRSSTSTSTVVKNGKCVPLRFLCVV